VQRHLPTRRNVWERHWVLPDRPWTNTTHDWRQDVDVDHLSTVRDAPNVYAAGGVGHLVLEVVAYAADEAEALGRRGASLVQLRADGSVLIVDDGRGTDTRIDSAGHPVRKPIMATRDLRFFDSPDPPVLGDGLPRRGISVVAALSTWLVHVNRRAEGAWSQAYRDGHPAKDLVPVPADGTTGTTVHFRACEGVRAIANVAASDLTVGLSAVREWLDVAVDDLR
jgi:topoisomerase-4 subunit B